MTKKCFLFALPLLLVACSGDDGNDEIEAQPDGRRTVNITTRAEDDASPTTVQAGLYMVNYRNEEPDELISTGNFVNNQLMTYASGQWSTATPIYWYDDTTPADFYAYAPYIADAADAHALPIKVAADQTTQDAFDKSDFLWGMISGQCPTDDSFNLMLSHCLSRLTVMVTADGGFAEGELKASDVSVSIGGTQRAATADLATGIVTPAGDRGSVACLPNGDLTYTAILVPQQVPFADFIVVKWQEDTFRLQNTFLLEAKRHYSLTVKLKKTKNGFDIGIDGWDIIDEDFGGSIGGN